MKSDVQDEDAASARKLLPWNSNSFSAAAGGGLVVGRSAWWSVLVCATANTARRLGPSVPVVDGDLGVSYHPIHTSVRSSVAGSSGSVHGRGSERVWS